MMRPHHQQPKSVTVKETTKRIGYATRQTDRFIQQGTLDAIHVNRSLSARKGV